MKRLWLKYVLTITRIWFKINQEKKLVKHCQIYVRTYEVINNCLAEYDPTQPPRLNEKVLKDKRKKLKETFERVLRLYVSIQQCSTCMSQYYQ